MVTPGARSPWQRVPPGYLDDAVCVDAEVEVSEDEEGYVAMFVGVEPVQGVLQRPPTVLAVWRRTLRTEAQGLPENRRQRTYNNTFTPHGQPDLPATECRLVLVVN